jgi:hypothetical protein
MKKLFFVILAAALFAPILGIAAPAVFVGLFLAGFTINKMEASFFAIPTQDARGVFTKILVAVYKEKTVPTQFLQSFFKTDVKFSKNVSIEVQRGSEKVAVDVSPFSEGNRNSMDSSTERIITPPFYHEYMVVNQHRLYDEAIMLISQGNSQNAPYIRELINEIANDFMMVQDKIVRSKELQASEVLHDGTVTLANGDVIDFKRKAASKVDLGGGNYWATGTVNPYKTLEDGCNFIRTKGKSMGGVYNAIFGSTALSDFLSNTLVKSRADIRNFRLDDVRAPQRDAQGASLHGEVSAGSYTLRLWSYPQFYDNATTNNIPYVDPKKVILLPENPKFIMQHALVPQLIEGNQLPQKGEYLIQEFVDTKKATHTMDIKSAVVAIPVAVDQMFTAKVVA